MASASKREWLECVRERQCGCARTVSSQARDCGCSSRLSRRGSRRSETAHEVGLSLRPAICLLCAALVSGADPCLLAGARLYPGRCRSTAEAPVEGTRDRFRCHVMFADHTSAWLCESQA